MRYFSIIMTLFILSQHLIAQEEVNTKVEKVIIVFKTHFDIGYTDFAEAVLQKYSSSMISNALNVLKETKDLPKDKHFVWTLPAWPMDQILRRSESQLKPQIEDAIKQGWFAVHALPFTFETEACDAEILVRGFNFSTTISKKYNIELPRDAKLTDVPSHSWFIPTLLHHADVNLLHIGCNLASSSPEIPLLFWWEGPDGSRLMTMYWAGSYGTSLTPPEGWPYKTWLAIIHTNDNQGPPSPSQVVEIIEKTSKLAPNAKIQIGRISDFYDALMVEKPDLEVVRGDMPDTWIHGFMSMPREVKTGRTTKKDIISLESLNTLFGIWTGEGLDIRGIISGAAENCLLFDEHTFGLAMEHGHSGYWSYGDSFKVNRAKGVYKPIEDSWKEKGDRVYQAEKIITPTLNRQLQQLANAVDVEGRRIVVYNPLPWKRDGLVTLQVSSKWNPLRAVQDLESRKIFNISNKNNVLQFIARDVPSMGYKTFVPADEIKNVVNEHLNIFEEFNLIENKFFKVQIDPVSGSISSLINKKSGQEMVEKGTEFQFGQYLYERFSRENTTNYTKSYVKGGWSWALNEMGRPNLSDEPYKAIRNTNPKIQFTKNHLSVSAVLLFSPEGENRHDYSVTITLYEGLPYIEIIWNIENKPAEPWPEAGWMCFPLNISKPEFKLGRLGGIVDPSKDFVKGSNFDYCFLNSGMAIVNDQGKGMGFCSRDVPAISLEKPGLWQYSGFAIPKKPRVFFNLYNNQWSTNFTEWIEGSWSARFYLWGIDEYDNESSITTPSEEVRVPLESVLASGPAGKLHDHATGISLSKKGILITAFCNNPDGEGMLLRIWENAGKSGSCMITLPRNSNYKYAEFCNLRGELKNKTVNVEDGKMEVHINAYQPVSLVLH